MPNWSDTPEERLRNNLASLRKKRGWSQSEVARRMVGFGFDNFNQMMVSRSEKGERPIRLNEVEGFALVFKVQMEHLYSPSPHLELKNRLEVAERLYKELLRLSYRYWEAQFELYSFEHGIPDTDEKTLLRIARILATDAEDATKIGLFNALGTDDQPSPVKERIERAVRREVLDTPAGERDLMRLVRKDYSEPRREPRTSSQSTTSSVPKETKT